MIVQTALRRQAGGEQRQQDHRRPKGQIPQQDALQQRGGHHGGEQEKELREEAGEAPCLIRAGFPIQTAFQPCDEAAHPDHRMPDPAEQGFGVAKDGFQREGAGQNKQRGQGRDDC
ncbi:hypothetical protein SKB0092_27530 [Roseomonas mucosa]